MFLIGIIVGIVCTIVGMVFYQRFMGRSTKNMFIGWSLGICVGLIVIACIDYIKVVVCGTN